MFVCVVALFAIVFTSVAASAASAAATMHASIGPESISVLHTHTHSVFACYKLV